MLLSMVPSDHGQDMQEDLSSERRSGLGLLRLLRLQRGTPHGVQGLRSQALRRASGEQNVVKPKNWVTRSGSCWSSQHQLLAGLAAILALNGCAGSIHDIDDWTWERGNACGYLHRSALEMLRSAQGRLDAETFKRYARKHDLLVPFDRWCDDNLTREQFACMLHAASLESLDECSR